MQATSSHLTANIITPPTGNILLTGDPPQRLQKGSVWFKPYPLPVYQAFETTFQFRIGANDAVLGGGDGIAFVIQNSSQGVCVCVCV